MKRLTIVGDLIKKEQSNTSANKTDKCEIIDKATDSCNEIINQKRTARTSNSQANRTGNTTSRTTTNQTRRTSQENTYQRSTANQSRTNNTDTKKNENTRRADANKFKEGILKDKQKRVNIKGRIVYEYVFTDNKGKDHTIYSENTYEELLSEKCRSYIERAVFSKNNLKNVYSYNVQNSDSQYGYIGKIKKNSYYINKVEEEIDNDIISYFRNEQLKKTQELKFGSGVLKRQTSKENGKPIGIKVYGKNVYKYIFVDNKGKNHTIHSENTFEELSKPEYQRYIERNVLSENDLKNIDSYDVQNSDSQYGYIGKIKNNSYYINKVEEEIDNNILNYFKGRELERPFITVAKDEHGKQKTITLSNGKRLYGYSVKRDRRESTEYRDIYFENNLQDFSQQLKIIKGTGKTRADVDEMLSGVIAQATNFSNISRSALFGYGGRLESSGVVIDRKVRKEIKERIQRIFATRQFKDLMTREREAMELLRNQETR